MVAPGDSGSPVYSYVTAGDVLGRGTMTASFRNVSCPGVSAIGSDTVWYAPLLRPPGDPEVGSPTHGGVDILTLRSPRPGRPGDGMVTAAPKADGMYTDRDTATADREAPADVRRALAMPGTPLPAAVRRMAGADFSSVRVRSDESARTLGAAAYTVGDQVVFAPGRYAPDTVPGMRLLLHELTHVAQQRQSRPGAHLTVGHRADPAEREASAIADAALRGGRIGGVTHGRTAEQVVRCDDDKHPEPHYPTKDEQEKIEELFRRKRTVQPAPPKPAAAGDPAKPADPVEVTVVHGKDLTTDQQLALAERLRYPLLTAIRGLGPPGATRGPVEEGAAFADVEKARQAVFERFGTYTSRVFTLTRDEALSLADRQKANQILVTFTSAEKAASTLAMTVAEDQQRCPTCATALEELSDDSRRKVLGALVGKLMASNGEELRKAAIAHVGGVHTRGTDQVNIPLPGTDTVFNTAVHELIHALAHPAFTAAFGKDERNLVEGFTEYFTRQIAPGSLGAYDTFVDAVTAVKSAMSGPFLMAVDAPGAEESLRLAYFAGRLDLIGWIPSGPDEEADVAKAMPAGAAPPKWNAKTAGEHAAAYRQRDVAAQAASSNVLGVGLFFETRPTGAEPTVTVRYARVLTGFDPLARGRLLAEGQLVGTPTTDPTTIGGSLGAAVEYQEPNFFLTGGTRFVGTAAPGGDSKRLDFSPFVGGGIRAWQTIRVGGEGFVLLPIAGAGIRWGGGLTIGVEFK